MIFEESKTGPITFKNRILRSATHESMADANGYPTERLIRKYETLAKHEVGGIITGFTGVMQNGKAIYQMLMIDSDSCIEPFSKLTERIHRYDTPIILQLAHCGLQTKSAQTGFPTVAPSKVKSPFFDDIPRELTEDETVEIIDSFVNGIIRAKKAGFDGVQLHLAHGYLLSQFLSSHTNRRKDHWGGSLENKYRMIDEIFQRARSAVDDFPILAKLNAMDFQKDGMRLSESIEIAKLLESSGCAAIEISNGVIDDGMSIARCEKLPIEAVFTYMPKYRDLPQPSKVITKLFAPLILKKRTPIRNYNVESASEIRKQVNIPVIVVGGIRNLDDIKVILKSSKADYVSLCRPLVAEPNLVRKFKEGSQLESRCIDCCYCLMAAETKELRCYRGSIQ